MADFSKVALQGHSAGLKIGTTPIQFATNVGLKPTVTYNEWDQYLGSTRYPSGCTRFPLKIDNAGPLEITAATHATAKILLATHFSGSAYTLPTDVNGTDNTVDIIVNDGQGTFTYADCWIPVLEISGEDEAPIAFNLTALGGGTRTAAGSVGAPMCATPYLHSDLTVTIIDGTSTVHPASTKLTFDQGVGDGKFRQSLTRTHLDAMVYKATVELSLPWNADNATFIEQCLTNAENQMTITLTQTDGSIAFNFGGIRFQGDGIPDIPGNGDIMATLIGEAFTTTAGAFLTVTVTDS